MATKLTIEIDMDNAAFIESPVEEVTRILYSIKDKVSLDFTAPEQIASLFDSNGNRVGRVVFSH